MLRVGVDLGLFTLLSKSETPLSVDEIAMATSASPQLLGETSALTIFMPKTLTGIGDLERILRYLAARNMIKETGANEYTAIRITHVLGDPEGKAMIYLGYVPNIRPIKPSCQLNLHVSTIKLQHPWTCDRRNARLLSREQLPRYHGYYKHTSTKGP